MCLAVPLNRALHPGRSTERRKLAARAWVLVGLLLCPTLLLAHADLPNFRALVEANQAAVVNISTHVASSGAETAASSDAELLRFLREHEREADVTEGVGSGFVLSPDGYIVTNHHVVQGADEIRVRLHDRRQLVATLIGSDSRSDIALLKVESDKPLSSVSIGDSSRLGVGDWVLAIGSPFGFEYSATAGIVSAKARSLPSERYVPFVQTDVAINPGNSGGPLFNLDGQVIAVNSQIFSRTGSFIGLSFAIPVELVVDVVEQLRAHGSVERGWLGIHVGEVDFQRARELGLDRAYGAWVRGVIEGGAADRAGLVEGDVITAFNGQPLIDAAALPPMVGRLRPGSEAVLTVLHQGHIENRSVTIDQLPDEESLALAGLEAGPAWIEPFDFAVLGTGGALERIPAAVDQLPGSTDGYPMEHPKRSDRSGVWVVEVDANGRSAAAGLRIGDRLIAVDGKTVNSPAALLAIGAALLPETAVELEIERDGQRRRFRLQ